MGGTANITADYVAKTAPPFEGSRPRVNFVTPVGAINQVAAAREGTQGCLGTLDQTGARLKIQLGGNESLTGDRPASLADWFLGQPSSD